MGDDKSLKEKVRVLLVEDNPGDRDLILEHLRVAGGFEVESASTLGEARKKLAEGEFDLVLLDLMLPDSQGIETLRRLREEAALSIVVLTGLEDEVLGVEAVKAGAQDYLVKGRVGPDSLARALRYALERYKSWDRLAKLHDFLCKMVALEDEGEVLNVVAEAARKILGYESSKVAILGPHEAAADPICGLPEGGSAFLIPMEKEGALKVICPRRLGQEEVRLLELLANQASILVHRARLSRKLREMALHDPLTGLHNRHYLFMVLDQEIKRSRRYGLPVGLLMVDVNGLKAINDTYGHQEGDQVLRAVAKLLRNTVRESDIVVRYGGDEFLLVLLELSDGGVEAVKKRILQKLQRLNAERVIPISVAIGGTCWDPKGERSVDEALREADTLMYEEKRKSPSQGGSGSKPLSNEASAPFSPRKARDTC